MKSSILPFASQAFENLIFFPIAVNNIETIAMFDTGAGMSFLSESIVKQMQEMQSGTAVNAGNNQGKISTYRTVRLDRLQIGDAEFQAQEVGVLPEDALSFGEDSAHNIFPASMLLGWDILSQLCWKVDMNRRFVEVYPGGIMPKNESLSWDSFPLIHIKYNGITYPVGFDSGHTESMLDETWIPRLHNLQHEHTTICGVGSTTEEEVLIAKEFVFKINETDIKLRRIEVAQHRIFGASENMCALLGADILCNAKWILDAGSRWFSIEK